VVFIHGASVGGVASQLLSTVLSDHMQQAIPSVVTPEEVSRKQSLGGAIELCAEAAGYSLDKQLALALKVDKGQLSRWHSGTEGVVWPKLSALMDACGNDAPVLWMAHQRGWDLHAMRRRESETQRENRLLREEVQALRRVLTSGVHA
jgi:plasmid maintenance system antidote protein VapI